MRVIPTNEPLSFILRNNCIDSPRLSFYVFVQTLPLSPLWSPPDMSDGPPAPRGTVTVTWDLIRHEWPAASYVGPRPPLKPPYK